jgi:hypothetical protein
MDRKRTEYKYIYFNFDAAYIFVYVLANLVVDRRSTCIIVRHIRPKWLTGYGFYGGDISDIYHCPMFAEWILYVALPHT